MKRSRIIHPSEDENDSLRKEHEQMMYVIKALGGGIWEFDVLSGALRCNRRWHEILGLDYDTQQVLSIDQFKPHIHPDDVERATMVDLEELRRLIVRDERYAIEFRIIHQDGKPRWIRSVASLVAGPGDQLRAIGCITNITPLLAPSHGVASFPGEAQKADLPTPNRRPGKRTSTVSLSAREAECLRWVSFGKTAKETAAILGKSPRTIEFHLDKAMKKLNAVNKVQAVFLAVELNLL